MMDQIPYFVTSHVALAVYDTGYRNFPKNLIIVYFNKFLLSIQHVPYCGWGANSIMVSVSSMVRFTRIFKILYHMTTAIITCRMLIPGYVTDETFPPSLFAFCDQISTFVYLSVDILISVDLLIQTLENAIRYAKHI